MIRGIQVIGLELDEEHLRARACLKVLLHEPVVLTTETLRPKGTVELDVNFWTHTDGELRIPL
ncbi:MAG: hypothetical protein ABIQ64_03020 [Candidatus Saccharimonadales bacterium]